MQQGEKAEELPQGPARLTVKDDVLNEGRERNNLHAIEAVELEHEDAPLGTLLSCSTSEDVQTTQPTMGHTISVARLLRGAICTGELDAQNPRPEPQQESTAKKQASPFKTGAASIEATEKENPPSVLSRVNPDETGTHPPAGFQTSEDQVNRSHVDCRICCFRPL